ncbi:hypothetical protein ACH492_26005 [Streptomyces sp. NPDC019443]|uniref:hypothetical protein n=1 Tax=Streptomyces sp. NPDC019443 TaxID=3365061 RepID=UPI0037A178C4
MLTGDVRHRASDCERPEPASPLGAARSAAAATVVPAVGQEFHGGIKSGLFLAGYVVAGDTEDDVAANMDKVAARFSGQAGRRPTEPMGGTQ